MFKPIKDFYEEVLRAACICSGMNEVCILRGKSEECSDVRVALVKVLSERMTDAQIACAMQLTRRGVNYIRTSYERKSWKWVVRSSVEAIRKQMEHDALQRK